MVANKNQEQEEVQLEKIQQEIEEWRPQLTKRNEEFVFQFEKAIADKNLRGRNKEIVLHEVIGQLIEGQPLGKTAQQLFGTPYYYAEVLEKSPTKEEMAPPRFLQMWGDNALFVGGLFSAIAGLMELLANGQQASNGLTLGLGVLIINFFMGGLAMTLMARYSKKMNSECTKAGFIRYVFVSMAVIGGWIFLLSLVVTFLPPIFNPMLTPPLYFFIAALAFLVRYFLQKKWSKPKF